MQPRGPRTGRRWTARDVTVALVGGVVILAALGGLLIIEERGGPFVYDLQAAGFPVTAAGSYETQGATGTTGPGGTCVPSVPPAGCTPARTELHLRLAGLPDLAPAARYVAALVGGDSRAVTLGALAWEDGVLVLDHEDAEDRRAYDRLQVAAVPATQAGTGEVVVYEADVQTGSAELTERYELQVASGSGSVRLDQIGAAAVSATAEVVLEGEAVRPGWVWRAWVEDEGSRDRRYVFFGDLGRDAEGRLVLDERVERVVLTEQERFVVSVEPEEAPRGTAPGGLLAYEALIPIR